MSDLELGVKNFSDTATNLFVDVPFNSNVVFWADARLAGKDVHGLVGMSCNNGHGVWGESKSVVGGGRVQTGPGRGVFGRGGTGVQGDGTQIGVFGAALRGTTAIGVRGQSPDNHGVFGDNLNTTTPLATGGCVGFTHDGFGTVGVVKSTPGRRPSSNNAALFGAVEFSGSRRSGDSVTALLANAASNGRRVEGFAGIFNGPVAINGPLTVFGSNFKSGAVRHPDGSHRRLYCIESPDSLFEDVGRARLRQGVAEVRLDRDFAALIRTGDYHVFLTAEGDCSGLYVSRRTGKGFTVRESGRGRSESGFSYRIVAKRRDVVAPRLERVKPPSTDTVKLREPRDVTQSRLLSEPQGGGPKPRKRRSAVKKSRARAARPRR